MNEYSKDYHKCTEEASQELKENARPELKKYLDDISGYNNILCAALAGGETYPVVGALVHNAGSVLVIINSLLLLTWKEK